MPELIATRPAAAPRLVDLHERAAAVVHIDGAVAELPRLFQEAFALTAGAIQASGAAFAGEPFARYQSVGPRVVADAGFPFAGTVEPHGRVEITSLPGGRAVTVRHEGTYDTLAEPWERGKAFIAAEGLTITSAPWECYLTGPDEPGPPITEIFFPVR